MIIRILTNHLGYDKFGPKKALIESDFNCGIKIFNLIDSMSGKSIYEGAVKYEGKVDHWKDYIFLSMDFSSFIDSGKFKISITSDGLDYVSESFEIREGLLEKETLSDVIFYFKSQRSSGRFDKADRSVPFFGDRDERVDVHGGWFDASGDTSKYLSHLSYANYFNPQQIPFVVWGMLEVHELMGRGRPAEKRVEFMRMRALEEAAHGGDFLVRMKDPSGYFYMTVFDKWTKSTGDRMICSYSTQAGIRAGSYQAGFRQGAGIAIAALARLSGLKSYGEYESVQYLQAAERAFLHLMENNAGYLDDGRENIIDDYCALMAASETYLATGKAGYLEYAGKRAGSLSERLTDEGWWRSDDGTRPYFHAVEAGFPVVALLRYLEAETDPDIRRNIIKVVRKSLEFELKVTGETVNPFGYARQVVKALDGEVKTSFFIPHKNETLYWWQGENARIASLAAAALKAAGMCGFDKDFNRKLYCYAIDQLNWILGMNPFDVCMMHAKGRNNPSYLDFVPNLAYGICNGITAGFDDEQDIDFMPSGYKDDPLQNWRWSEQWIPHAAWFAVAVAALPAPGNDCEISGL